MRLLTATLLVASCSVSFSQDQPAGRFSGYIFGDYYYNIARDASFGGTAPSNAASGTAAPGPTAMQAFQLRRIYFTYDNDISEQFTTRFRLEVDQGTDVLTSGKISAFVKEAYLRWKNVFSGSDFIFGIQPSPTFDVSETAWGYRSLEKTIMDLRGIAPSRDQGVSLKGKVTDNGSLNYWVMWANNSANAPETDKYKRYYAHVQVKPLANLQATAYVDLKDAANVPDPSKPGSTLSHATTTAALFVGYEGQGKFSVGLEGFMASTPNDFTKSGTMATRNTIGASVFGVLNLSTDVALVARYDSYNPNTDNDARDPSKVSTAVVTGSLARNLIIAGLDWRANKNVSIIPNLFYESYEGATGGTAPDPSITARVTFYFVFL